MKSVQKKYKPLMRKVYAVGNKVFSDLHLITGPAITGEPGITGDPGITGPDGESPELSSILASQGASYIVVQATGTHVENGAALQAAYAEAKTRTPYGLALSATNRIAVILTPGRYNLGSTPLTLDTQYVDIIGLSNDRTKQHIYGNPPNENSGVVVQTANDVKLFNLLLEIKTYNATGSESSPTLSTAYFPNTNLSLAYVVNVEFVESEFGMMNQTDGMRAAIEYSGTFIDCVCLDRNGFGGFGIASGTFINCDGGMYSFGAGNGSSLASGTFINCRADSMSFGYNGEGSGMFIDCKGDGSCFGGGTGGTASGTFIRCIGGNGCFGGGIWANALASGKFEHCKGGQDSFGGDQGALTGQLYFCHLTAGTFQTPTGAGKIRYCIDGNDAVHTEVNPT